MPSSPPTPEDRSRHRPSNPSSGCSPRYASSAKRCAQTAADADRRRGGWVQGRRLLRPAIAKRGEFHGGNHVGRTDPFGLPGRVADETHRSDAGSQALPMSRSISTACVSRFARRGNDVLPDDVRAMHERHQPGSSAVGAELVAYDNAWKRSRCGPRADVAALLRYSGERIVAPHNPGTWLRLTPSRVRPLAAATAKLHLARQGPGVADVVPRRRIERPTCPLGGGCSIH